MLLSIPLPSLTDIQNTLRTLTQKISNAVFTSLIHHIHQAVKTRTLFPFSSIKHHLGVCTNPQKFAKSERTKIHYCKTILTLAWNVCKFCKCFRFSCILNNWQYYKYDVRHGWCCPLCGSKNWITIDTTLLIHALTQSLLPWKWPSFAKLILRYLKNLNTSKDDEPRLLRDLYFKERG